MAAMDLFSESSSSSSRSSSPEVEVIEVNEDYAKRFQYNKQREELHRLQDKYGSAAAAKAERELDDDDDESSSEDETEDEDGEQVTADVDAAILTTLAKIRRKDESIYQTGKRVFDEERALASQSKLLPRTISKGKQGKGKVTLGEYQRNRIQELIRTSDDPAKALADQTIIERRQDGMRYDEEDDEKSALPHSREQEELRREVTNAFHSSAGDGDDDFFTKRTADNDVEEDPESYRDFMLEVLGGKDKEAELREILRNQAEEAAAGDVPEPARGKAPKVREEDATQQENEEFLMNYVLNRGWVDNPSAAPRASGSKPVKKDKEEEKIAVDGFSDLDSEDSFDSRAEAFENAYNFRFEEMEAEEAEAQIQSYARNPIGSVRRKEDKRKKERDERAQRKQQEKEEKKKEIDRMRDLKRKSIVDRLKKLKEATGASNVDFERFQLDDEFDPEEHDRLMQQAFDEQYYGDDVDAKKPKWDDDLDIGNEEGESQKRKKDKKKQKGKGGEDVVEMDADFIDDDQPMHQEKKLTKAEKKKLKKREKAKAKKLEEQGVDGGEMEVEEEEMDADVAAEIKDIEALNPAQRKRKMEEAMDEYYGLEYEDMIGDQPTRFKYATVPKSTFGLTAEEILLADDDALNNVVSLKRLQPYRDGKRKPSDLNARVKEFRRHFRQKQEAKQQQQQQQQQGKEGDEETQDKSKTKRMGKKERQRRKEAAEKAKAAVNAATVDDGDAAAAAASAPPPTKKTKSAS